MQDILFLAIFLGTPVLMALAVLWLIVRAIRARLSFGSALRDGWEAQTEDELRRRLQDFPPLQRQPKVHLDRIATKALRGVEVTVARYRWTSKGTQGHRQGRHNAWLIMPAGAQLGRAVISKRLGGFLEGAVEALAADAIRSDLPPEWDWARVSGPADKAWFTAARAAGLKAAMGMGEELYLHDRILVLSREADKHPGLLRDAQDLLDAFTAALD